MPREIKLPRVWDKIDKEMMSPAKWEEDCVGGGNKKIGLYIYRSKKDPTQHSSLDWVLKHPESFDVMWPTGLKDKHGKEIYDRDKLKSGKRVLIVLWNEVELQWQVKEEGTSLQAPMCQWAISEQFEIIHDKGEENARPNGSN